MSINREKAATKEINDEQLDEVAGGAWGYHTYHDESAYNACGIETEWTEWYYPIAPFVRDDFKWKGEKIDKGAAAAIVFYHHKHGKAPKDLNTAISYKAANLSAFEADVKGTNAD